MSQLGPVPHYMKNEYSKCQKYDKKLLPKYQQVLSDCLIQNKGENWTELIINNQIFI